MNRTKNQELLLYICYIAFIISLVCSYRVVSSLSTGLILITSLIKNKTETGSWLHIKPLNYFMLACSLFYLIQVTVLLSEGNTYESFKHVQLKSAILFVPIALSCSNYLNEAIRHKLMRFFIGVLSLVILYCLVIASYKYFFLHARDSVFYYHDLVIPFRQHAVQVSIYLFIGYIYLLEQARNTVYLYKKPVHFFMIFYFTCCILLLSSKLVIFFTAASLIYYLILAIKAGSKKRGFIAGSLFAGLLMIILVLITQNRISERFREIISGDLKLSSQQQFNPGIYFNGLQFRFLQIRFVKEILTEQHAWITGVSSDAQSLLDKKYISTRMYIGNGNPSDRGFLGYNTHNQFLESLLVSGIVGLITFTLVCMSMIQMCFQRKNREFTIIIFLLLTYCLNESVFETQYGIMLFTFFPLLIYYGTRENNNPV